MKKAFAILITVSFLLAAFAGIGVAEAQKSAPKYIFMFIGDGMSAVQTNAAQVFEGDNILGQVATENLNFTQFEACGMITTHDSTSFCPDSASTATSLASGVKTHSGTIGLEVDKETVATNIAELLKANGKKIGIVSTVTINHATPAAYYAHVASRNDYYDIAMQMAASGFDYFGGGSISKATGAEGDQKDAYAVLEENGYTIVNTKEEIEALNADSGKVYAVSPELQDSGAMYYALDAGEESLTLADFVRKGIDVLDNENGFFMMAESGKIDWACHANDAMATIAEVSDFADAIAVAIDFAGEHPEETLIVVTGDHETGGMTIGYASTGYSTAFDVLSAQKMSFTAFDEAIAAMKEENPDLTLEDVLPMIEENFGLKAANGTETEENVFVLTEYELEKLSDGFAQSMKAEEERDQGTEADLLYGGYDPLSVTITHILNNKAGIGWTSYAHTGVPVPVYATGVGAEEFGGFYDNTEVFTKLCEICGLI